MSGGAWVFGLGLDALVLLGLLSAVRAVPRARATLQQEISAEVGRQIEPLVTEIRALTEAIGKDCEPAVVDLRGGRAVYVLTDDDEDEDDEPALRRN